MVNPWTDYEIGILKAGAEARLSAGQIASQLNRSRNAVIGFMARHGIVNQHKGLKVRAPKRRVERKRIAAKRERLEFYLPQGPIEPLKVRYVDLSPWHCRYLLDEKDDYGLRLSCGLRKLKGCSFCPAHAAIVYLPPTTRNEP